MNQKGFIQIPILIAIIVGVLVLGGAYVAVKHFNQPTGQLSVPSSLEQSPPSGQSPNQPSGDKCGDSICDAFETANPNACPQDCGGSVPSGSPGQSSGQPTQGQTTGQNTQSSSISVKATGAKYKTVSAKSASGWFQTGQDADIMLSGIDFNNTGGALLFNHPGVVASDGTHLLLADRNNNRVLIWNKLPTGNTPPDLVLGQKDFTANNPGTGLDQMNWPVSVSVGGGKVVITDTYNDRILIWNSFPTKNGQSADLVINSVQGNKQQLQAEKK